MHGGDYPAGNGGILGLCMENYGMDAVPLYLRSGRKEAAWEKRRYVRFVTGGSWT